MNLHYIYATLYLMKKFFLPQAIKKIPLNRRGWHKLWKNKKFKKVLKWTLIGFGIFFVGMIAWFSKDLPTPSKIKEWRPALSSEILDRNGKSLYEVHGDQRRNWIDFKDIPENIKKATLTAEDREFYKHFGINFKGLARAALRDILHRGYAEGGSGLTQQFVKNALLTPKRTFSRKIKEAILSIELEILYSKDKIFEMYLNTIPYGSNAYGVEAATQTYFGKSAKNLTLAESATLAALPRAPSYYSPYGLHKDDLLARKDYLLDEMVKNKQISQEEANQAKKQKLAFQPYHENILAPHFVMWVKELLSEKYGEKIVETGGLKVYTTLDYDLQSIAQETVRTGAEANAAQFGGDDASLVSIDPKTGQILAMVGSRDYFNEDIQGYVNVALRPRQPGSSFKPVVYATLFKGHWAPGYTVFDVETDFGGGYKPKNYTEQNYGPITLRTALANSLNVPSVKVLYLAGMDNVLATAKDLGITTLTDPERFGLSLVLGGGEVKLLELTGAYTAFAQSGKFAQPYPILKVLDNKGKILEENKPHIKQVLPEEIAYEIWDMLTDQNARAMIFGGVSTMSLPDRKVGVKTGTTSDWRDAWTFGFMPNLVTGVWAGNADNRPMAGASAAIAATPIWYNFTMAVKDKFPIEDVPRPKNIQTSSIAWISNKQPTDSSPRVITDIFAPWQLPRETDDIFIKKKICKITGLLAGDDHPANITEEKTFANIHSEVPDNPSWEAPVIGWAQANGYTNYPPNEYCTEHSNSQAPKISVNSPSNNATVSGNVPFSLNITSQWGLSKLNFYLDGTLTRSITSPPYSYILPSASYANGTHSIRILATDHIGLQGETTIRLRFDNTSVPDVSGLSAALFGGNGAKLTWSNPSGISFLRIYRSIISGNLGDLIEDNFLGSEYIDSPLVSNTYYYTLKCVDGSNNESSGASVSITIP